MILFDAYELRARLAPTVIVLSPWIMVGLGYTQSISVTLLTTSSALVVFLSILYAFTFAVRSLGRRAEVWLWKSWGGPPSTTIMSDSDITFTDETKARIRTSLKDTLAVTNASDTSWCNSESQVQQAFRLVRRFIHLHDPNGLWEKHNAEYGFLRNLLGSLWLLLLSALVGAVICGVLWHIKGGGMLGVLCILNVLFAAMSVVLRWIILPSAIRQTAHRYAESAWSSFDAITASKVSS